MGKVVSSLGNSYCQHCASNRFQRYKTLSAVNIDTARDATAIPVVIHHLKFSFLDAERAFARSLSKIAFRCFASASRSEQRLSLLLRNRSVSNAVLCWASSTAFLGSGGRAGISSRRMLDGSNFSIPGFPFASWHKNAMLTLPYYQKSTNSASRNMCLPYPKWPISQKGILSSSPKESDLIGDRSHSLPIQFA